MSSEPAQKEVHRYCLSHVRPGARPIVDVLGKGCPHPFSCTRRPCFTSLLARTGKDRQDAQNNSPFPRRSATLTTPHHKIPERLSTPSSLRATLWTLSVAPYSAALHWHHPETPTSISTPPQPPPARLCTSPGPSPQREHHSHRMQPPLLGTGTLCCFIHSFIHSFAFILPSSPRAFTRRRRRQPTLPAPQIHHLASIVLEAIHIAYLSSTLGT